MRRARYFVLASLLSVSFATSALAGERTTRNPTYTARRAFQEAYQRETGRWLKGNKVHSHFIQNLRYTKDNDWTFGDRINPKYKFYKVMVWKGRERGPGARKWAGPSGVRVALVPRSEGKQTVKQLVAGTLISGDLTQAGSDRVKAHLLAKGLSPKTVRLGDFVKPYSWGNSKRLSQKPISRANGYLRYTVEFADGSTKRYLVKTNSRNLRNGGELLGKVFADTDLYR